MEHIRLALEKASDSRKDDGQVARRTPSQQRGSNGVTSYHELDTVLPKCVLDGRRLEEMRVVTYLRRHPSHFAFDMLRTKIAQIMKEHRWASLMVTSPTPGCGKTVVSANLAFSMAQDMNRKIALVDLDLRSPRLNAVLGTTPAGDMLAYLRGQIGVSSLFSQVGENLFLALNDAPIGRSAEWMRDERITSMPGQIRRLLGADIVIFDVPPALTSDDAMAFSQSVDCAIVIAAARQTTPREIEDCEGLLLHTNYLGVTLNKVVGADLPRYGYGL
jgi:protein-tyrosine kinase